MRTLVTGQRTGNRCTRRAARPTTAPEPRGALAELRQCVGELEAKLAESIVQLTKLAAIVVDGRGIDDTTELGDIRAALGAALVDCDGVMSLAAKAVHS